MIHPGQYARTPFEPSGLVRVIEIEPGLSGRLPTALVQFVENHPYGYPAGSFGRYYVDELTLVEEHS